MGEATGDFYDDSDLSNSDINLYYYGRLKMDALERPACRKRYETIRRYLEIRRSFPEIFTSFPDNHKESRIVKIAVSGLDSYQPYARYAQGKAVLVVPNATQTEAHVTISIPAVPGLSESCTVTDLLSGEVLGRTSMFSASIASGELGLYLVC